MATNIEIQYYNSSGNYETLYPSTTNSIVQGHTIHGSGSYIGTGTYGNSGYTTITIPRVVNTNAVIVFISNVTGQAYSYFNNYFAFLRLGGGPYYWQGVIFDMAKKAIASLGSAFYEVNIYRTNIILSNSSAEYQMNVSNVTYYWMSIDWEQI